MYEILRLCPWSLSFIALISIGVALVFNGH